MLNLEYPQENEIHKLFWDFEIQADQLISARWPDHVRVNKNKDSPK